MTGDTATARVSLRVTGSCTKIGWCSRHEANGERWWKITDAGRRALRENATVPIHDGPYRYIVKADFEGVRVTVNKCWSKSEAKALRNKLREQFGDLGASFFLVYEAPRPRWKQLKRSLSERRLSDQDSVLAGD